LVTPCQLLELRTVDIDNNVLMVTTEIKHSMNRTMSVKCTEAVMRKFCPD